MDRHDPYRPALFFALAYLGTWIPWSLAIHAGSQEKLAPYAVLFQFLGLAAPCAVGVLLVFTSGSDALKRDFKDRLLNLRRIRPGYLLVAVLLPLAVLGLSIWLSLWFGQSADQFRLSGGANLLPMIVLALILAPILEEVGWHGYGVDSLRAVTGMTKATLLFAVLWAVWHAPLTFIVGTYQNALAMMDNKLFLANFFISIIPAAIIANWFYYQNDRSIVAAVLLHSGLNAASVLLNAGQVAKCISTLIYAAIAAALMIFDRALFAGGPRNFLTAGARVGASLGSRMQLSRAQTWLIVTGIIFVAAAALYLMGHPLICKCGYVKLWHFDVRSAENSQHLFDWYTPSHIIHGFIFYWLLWLMSRWVPMSFGLRLVLAVAIEASWEVVENTDWVINHYREMTISLDYYGDSVINSVMDILFMVLGFYLAAWWPVWLTVAVGIALELFVGAMIRDNLTLNVLMFLWPLESVLHWQQGR